MAKWAIVMKRLIGWLLVGLALIGAMTYLALTDYHAKALPRSAQAEQGATVPMNYHGTVVYLTNGQATLLFLLQTGWIVTGIIGGLLTTANSKRG
ncbi:hypothetical protein EN813_044785 [Mesorhizobium sp. M00.F.Ca.ET.170.01.1.1]|nr:hypothetical protein EN813_044785 [Mesorhizobium sp. M00.F.Ca.ET.170.01.1.1]